ncbi:hypothetical protein XE97_24630 [Salmonella enterica subsp. enterica serovar Senftenberg]|nr:hypothetical protein [Salmonella enterica subsp. enterica serovar Senftenberg]
MDGQVQQADARGRAVVTASDIAARLDSRLYAAEFTGDELRQGCGTAVREGVGAVITLPERVEEAAPTLHGSAVGLATVLAWHTPDSDRLTLEGIRLQAMDLVAKGATEVAYLITRERLHYGDGREVADHIAHLVDTLTPLGARVRTILATDDLTDEQIVRTCGDVAAAGAWMVHGGSWRGRRTGLTQLELMRAELPRHVLLKWTHPVKHLATLLLAMSLGVDRFNGDVDELLRHAKRAEWLAPLSIPVAGMDY